MQIDGSVAVITGGASGLGAGTARRLVAGGGRVALFDLPASAGKDLVAELGDGCAFVPVDVSDTDAVASAVFPKCLGTPDDFAKLVQSFIENTLLNGDIVRLDAATRL